VSWLKRESNVATRKKIIIKKSLKAKTDFIAVESLLILILFCLTFRPSRMKLTRGRKIIKKFQPKKWFSRTRQTHEKKRWEHSLTGSWLKWSCHLPDDLVTFDPVHDFYVSFLVSFVLPTSAIFFSSLPFLLCSPRF